MRPTLAQIFSRTPGPSEGLRRWQPETYDALVRIFGREQDEPPQRDAPDSAGEGLTPER